MHFRSRNRFNPRHGQGSTPVSGTRSIRTLTAPHTSTEPSTPPQANTESHAPKTSAARSSLIMFLGTLISRALGMVRSPILLGAVVGVSTPVANSFDIANNVPNLLYGIIAGGLVNAVLVPAIVRATEKSRTDGAIFINKLLTFSFVTLGAMTLVITAAAPLIVNFYASTMSSEWYQLTVIFSFWCLPQIFFYGLYAVLGQILNAYEKFGPYMWSPALNNVVAIGGLITMLALFGPEDSTNPSSAADWAGAPTMILAGVSTLGIVVQALILFVPLYRLGIRYRPDFQWRNSGLGAVGRAGSWVLALMFTGMVPIMILLNIAAGATQRAIDAGQDTTLVAGNFMYTIAYALYSLPSSLVAISIITAVFPRMSRAAARNDFAAVRSDVSISIRTIGVFNVLASALIFVLAVPVAKVVTPTSTSQEAWALAWVLAALTLGLVFGSADAVLMKVFYAFEDTKTAFLTVLPLHILTPILYLQTVFLPPQWTVVGLCLVSSFENVIFIGIHAWVLRRRLGGLDTRRIIRTHLQLGGLGIIVSLVGYAIMLGFGYDAVASSFSLAIVSIIVVTFVMSSIFVVLLKLSKMPEGEILLGPIRAIFRKILSRSRR
ncbi:murein biosynthesis integral membrane protein MurJ [Arcanobacterium buesumense]|uniref:Virulence factor MviN n=1 Tax=Arcanobacterium buesumense TaxID=2722751 RepID=A0A6H2EJU6_9ACTO|nr:lipid II flippase MurJ [Arcanobacterium buesumense]QJC21243.1 virulence factor MviN [Arcanobacterium buesumense]